MTTKIRTPQEQAISDIVVIRDTIARNLAGIPSHLVVMALASAIVQQVCMEAPTMLMGRKRCRELGEAMADNLKNNWPAVEEFRRKGHNGGLPQ